jgi:CubicO group peptidase (beta-lactamase class C family)
MTLSGCEHDVKEEGPMLNPLVAVRVALLAVLLVLSLGPASTARAQRTAPAPTVRTPESEGMSAERLPRISAWLKQEIDEGRLPGAVVLVARNGKIVYQDSVGMLDKERTVAMRQDAMFRVASMTKPIVSVATMMMVEQGRLKLADPVSVYLPELKELKVAKDPTFRTTDTEPARPMTVHDLLRHSSGLTYWFIGQKGPIQTRYQDEDIDGLHSMDAGEMLRKLADIPLLFQPGTTFNYSVSTDVLGHVLERVAGKGLDRILEEMIFTPLGMKDTSFWVASDKLGRLAQPFTNDPDPWIFKWLDVSKPPKRFSGGAGLAGTANDYHRFAQMVANGGVLDGARLLSPKTVQYMISDHLGIGGGGPIAKGPAYLPGDGYGFGLGFAVRVADGLSNLIGTRGDAHWGGITGPAFWIDQKEGLVAILMLQAPRHRFYNRMVLRNLVYGAVLQLK